MPEPLLDLTWSRLKILEYLQHAEDPKTSGAAISKATGIGAGTLYPDLYKMEQAHWIDSAWEVLSPEEPDRPRRRFYALTTVGLGKL